MKIYVDFDDCLCETAFNFSKIAEEMFGKKVPYEKIGYFDLKKSFSLTDEQYDRMMTEGHRPEVLLAYKETPGASETLNSWVDKGYDVSVITGRPYSAYEPSRQWLDEHGLERVKMFCFNKYGRDSFLKNSGFSLELEDYYKMKFDYAVEDSPSAFRFFDHMPELKVMVFDRPWNRNVKLPGENYMRCTGWKMIKQMVV
ncbi:MAG: 2-dehydropantoate 2-reductase [Lachnospiraceae bacterium]|nr:2-dehydropantoate 2-reductase [Lachnospiraceae bacterium]